ncbi:MAG: hypothetical protein HYY36_00820 [Gammaproteobacteria bacterium]|nr:hypothetical protein [Gammaproteobacteria bacterium]
MRNFTGIVHLLFAAALTGCASDAQKREAVNDINQEFRQAYEHILLAKGTRSFPVSTRQAVSAMAAVLRSMDMQITIEDPATGFLQAMAPAPRPLDDGEWTRAVKADEPMLKRIAARHVGLAAMFIAFHPEGLDVVVTAAAVQISSAAEVSLTMRLKEVTPIRTGFPRREYPPPTAVSIGLDKIWDRFEQGLRVGEAAGP